MRMQFYFKSWLQWLGAGLLLGSACLVEAGIESTKHNLSSTSTAGDPIYRATSEQRMCLMCHAPHSANPAGPLWNHKLSGATYTPYSSSTLNAAPGQPTGASKLCLACHDGTVAVGALLNMPGAIQGYSVGEPYYDGTIAGLDEMITGVANLGVDLRDDHPVSFVFDSTLAGYSLEFNDPAGLTDKVRLDGNDEMQCTSCHEPHSDEFPKFLRMAFRDSGGYGSPLCIECHDKDGWSEVGNKHRESLAEWNGLGDNPWHIDGQNVAGDQTAGVGIADTASTPRANGCESCHQPHNAPNGNERLLKYDAESGLCMVCHNGNVSDNADETYDMDTPFAYTYNHTSLDAAYDGKHSPVRDPVTYNIRETSYQSESGGPNTLGDQRHAECQDCHNPHYALEGVSPNMDAGLDLASWPNQGSNGGTTMDAAPVIKGVWGVQPDSYPAVVKGFPRPAIIPGDAPATADWGVTATSPYNQTWPGTYTETFTEVESVAYQYQLCFKCHSYYAYGPNPPDDAWGAFDWVSQGASYAPGWSGEQTDQSMEFNPNNASYHPVAAVGRNDFIRGGTDYNFSLLGNLTADSTMSCTDCHSNENYIAAGLAKGPHGSATWPNLWAPYTGLTGTRNEGDGDTFATHLCFKCHRPDTYGASGCFESHSNETGFVDVDKDKNLHCYHVNGEDIPCQACHAAVPHGWKRPHLLIAGDGPNPDPAPYNSHAHYRYDNRYRYGFDSRTNFDTASGNWEKNVCHQYSLQCK